jgi:phenylpropionate dioxygenase-like ring-hydroxylating dioxygenase large terminal subunit
MTASKSAQASAVPASREAEIRSDEAKLRPDFVPKDAYLSREFLQLENERLWPKVWQVACRLEEIPKVGNYVTYEVAGESIIILRTGAEEIKSFYNVCQHRGRRLREPASHGNASSLYCRYHGWSWNIDGSVARILDPEDWQGCPDFRQSDLRLKETLIDTWGGWVFINMDRNAEPLQAFLDPVPAFVDPFELDRMRMRWYKTTVFPCNWKVAVEAFIEGYHVGATHPQLQNLSDDLSRSHAQGKHGMFFQAFNRPVGAPSARTGKPVPADIRAGYIRFYTILEEQLKALISQRAMEANRRLLTEVPADTPPMEVIMRALEFQKEAAIRSGAGWPEITLEQMGKAGVDWHVFPNHAFLMTPDAYLGFRARPNGDNPNSCIFDIWSLVRYAPGAEPKVEREFYPDGLADPVGAFGFILSQDIANMTEVQAGMNSRGFAGSRTNPLQESTVYNLHRVVRQYLFGEK